MLSRRCPSCGRENRIPGRHVADTGRCGACKTALPAAAAPLDVTDARSFDEVVREAPVPVLVDFWAPWCGPCRAAAPAVAGVAADMAGRAVVIKVNTDEQPELATRYQVRSIPNFAVFVHGRVVRQSAGLVSREQLRAWLGQAGASAA